MKHFALLGMVFALFFLAGCAHRPPAPEPAATIVTPSNPLAGHVVACNAAGRFVVLNFPASPVPPADQFLFLYRAGLKVAELKITGPQSDDNTVADILSGEAQVGDEVRAE